MPIQGELSRYTGGGGYLPISAVPANALVQRDGTLIIQRDLQQIVNQRP